MGRLIISLAFLLILVARNVSSTVLKPQALIGVKNETQQCSYAMECKEPFYCLRRSDSIKYSCQTMPCNAQLKCRIGQQCSTNGFCEALNCNSDTVCPGTTVCVNGGCRSKSSAGESCTRDEMCWSETCTSGVCLSAFIPDRPFTRNRAVDITISVLLILSILTLLLVCIISLARCSSKRNPQAIPEEDLADSEPTDLNRETGIDSETNVTLDPGSGQRIPGTNLQSETAPVPQTGVLHRV